MGTGRMSQPCEFRDWQLPGSDVIGVSFFLEFFDSISPRKSRTEDPTTDLESPSKVVWGLSEVNAMAKPKTVFFSDFFTKTETMDTSVFCLNFVLTRNFTDL